MSLVIAACTFCYHESCAMPMETRRYRTAEYERSAQFLIKRFPPIEKDKHLIWLNVLRYIKCNLKIKFDVYLLNVLQGKQTAMNRHNMQTFTCPPIQQNAYTKCGIMD